MYEDQIGFLLAATNRVADAIPHLQKATDLDQKLGVAWYHLGVAQCLAQLTDACIGSLQRAVVLTPGNGDYRLRLGSAYSEIGRFADLRFRVESQRNNCGIALIQFTAMSMASALL